MIGYLSHQRITIKTGLEMNIVTWIKNWLESYKHRAMKHNKTFSREASSSSGLQFILKKSRV